MQNSAVCLDANLIVRTLTPGPFSQEADALLLHWRQTRVRLLAPTLVVFEVTSALRRMVHQQAIAPAQGEAAFAAFWRIPLRLSERPALIRLAWELAKQFNQSRAYDTAYLALAQLHHCDFWTADRKLYNAVHAQLPWVKWVGDAQV